MDIAAFGHIGFDNKCYSRSETYKRSLNNSQADVNFTFYEQLVKDDYRKMSRYPIRIKASIFNLNLMVPAQLLFFKKKSHNKDYSGPTKHLTACPYVQIN